MVYFGALRIISSRIQTPRLKVRMKMSASSFPISLHQQRIIIALSAHMKTAIFPVIKLQLTQAKN